MNSVVRLALILVSVVLCASGLVVTNRTIELSANTVGPDHGTFASEYEKVASAPPRELTFSEFESIIRRHSTVKVHKGRIEFGSVKMEGATAVVQVLFFAPDGQMTPFFYVLVPKNKTWKVENVQRIWFVPRSILLRGLRV